jgi:hypothetical protein
MGTNKARNVRALTGKDEIKTPTKGPVVFFVF